MAEIGPSTFEVDIFQVGHAGNPFTSASYISVMIRKMAQDGQEASISGIIGYAANDPDYATIVGQLHYSKESIRYYYIGWPVQKNSPFLNEINYHILLLHQVLLFLTPLKL